LGYHPEIETSMRPLLPISSIAALLLAAMIGSAQSSPKAEPRTVLDGPEVRVSSYQVPAGQSLSLQAKNGDAIVILGDPVSWSEAAEDSEGDAEPGEPLFLTQGARHLFYPSEGDRSAFAIYQVDLKHHWTTGMRTCDSARRCVRAIKIGNRTMGQARFFFTNGEVNAVRYQLFKGGTLSQPYSTAKAKFDVLVVALGPLSASAEGDDVSLETGEAHLFSKVQKLDVRTTADTTTFLAIQLPAAD
jgi:hypothetical protein